MMHRYVNGQWEHVDDPQPSELPERSNGYPVVAACMNCGELLTLWNDYRGVPRLAHVSNLEHTCPIWYYAKADRPVVELGLLHESNAQ